MVRGRRGALVAVTDGEMLEAQRDLAAMEGLYCQPEFATTLAALKKIASGGPRIGGDGPAVLILTASGLKSAHHPAGTFLTFTA